KVHVIDANTIWLETVDADGNGIGQAVSLDTDDTGTRKATIALTRIDLEHQKTKTTTKDDSDGNGTQETTIEKDGKTDAFVTAYGANEQQANENTLTF